MNKMELLEKINSSAYLCRDAWTHLYHGKTFVAYNNGCNFFKTKRGAEGYIKRQLTSAHTTHHTVTHSLYHLITLPITHHTPTATAHGTRWLLSSYIYYIHILFIYLLSSILSNSIQQLHTRNYKQAQTNGAP